MNPSVTLRGGDHRVIVERNLSVNGIPHGESPMEITAVVATRRNGRRERIPEYIHLQMAVQRAVQSRRPTVWRSAEREPARKLIVSAQASVKRDLYSDGARARIIARIFGGIVGHGFHRPAPPVDPPVNR